MRLLACSYHNIGPFLDRERTVQFLEGATLIKAPIGSGKSFLFFDGPIFALYKWSSRPMLHRLASSGQIQILFSHEGQVRMIIRNLKATKAGNDSVTTKFFRVNQPIETITHVLDTALGAVITDGKMVASFIPEARCETFESTQQKEVDTMILDVIPPREVILSSCVLLQESDNIFEMTPATRISVFKQLFQLLDIDHVRERLADNRKQVQTRRLVLQEDTSHERALRSLLEKIKGISEREEYLAGSGEIKQFFEQPFFVDLKTLNLDELHTTGRTTKGFDKEQGEKIISVQEHAIQTLLFQQGQVEQRRTQLTEAQQRITHLRTQQQDLEKSLEQCIRTLTVMSDQTWRGAQEELTGLEVAQQALYSRLPHSIVHTFGVQRATLNEAEQYCTTRITETKHEKLRAEELEKRLSEREKELSDAKERATRLEEQIKQGEENAKQSERFVCDKIQGDCPYVSMINKASSKVLDQQIDYLREQRETLLTQTIPTIGQNLEQIRSEAGAVQQIIEASAAFFGAIGRTAVNELFVKAREHEAAMRTLQQTIREHANDAERLREAQEQRTVLETKREGLREAILAQETLLTSLTNETSGSGSDLQDQIRTLKVSVTGIQEICSLIEQADDLAARVLERSEEIRQLQEKEGLLKDLVGVFQKELLLVVLQDFLPLLEKVINESLAKVCEFQLRFELPKTMQEQIELNIRIDDHHGARAVKSLSGGQKALLRLCRIIAVSTLFQQEFLLLDETINSLDHEAIGRVATLFDDFVKQREVSFYLVTHAPQIQEMDFWRRIVEV